MKKLCIGLFALAAVFFSQPSFADCGSYNQVEYVRSSQRERGTDFRIKVRLDDIVTTNSPVVDVKTTLVDSTEVIAYTFTLSENVASGNWSYDDRTDTTYTRVRLTTNYDGTSALRVAMRVPYSVFNAGLGYYASVRTCE